MTLKELDSEANTKKIGGNMEEKEPVVEEMTENVEETTEQTEVVEEIKEPEKVYTEDDFNKKIDDILPKKLARREAKVRKEYEKKYGKLETVLKAGLNVGSVEEATQRLEQFYTEQGAKIPSEPTYSERDVEVLANAEANDIIDASNYEELEEEANRLADIGLDNMTKREKLVFTKIAEHLKTEKELKELATMGISKEALNDKEFVEFSKDLNPAMSPKEKWEKYIKYRPKPKVEPIGSMKGNSQPDSKIKEFYTYDEAKQFTMEDFNKNPKLYEAVERSSYKW